MRTDEPLSDRDLIANLGYLADFDEERVREWPRSVRRDAAEQRARLLRLAAARLTELTRE